MSHARTARVEALPSNGGKPRCRRHRVPVDSTPSSQTGRDPEGRKPARATDLSKEADASCEIRRPYSAEQRGVSGLNQLSGCRFARTTDEKPDSAQFMNENGRVDISLAQVVAIEAGTAAADVLCKLDIVLVGGAKIGSVGESMRELLCVRPGFLA